MDLTEARLKIFSTYVILVHNVQSLFLTIGCFIPVRMSTSMLIIIWNNHTLKASNNSIVAISVQLELITLAVCKSQMLHFLFSELHKYN